MTTRRPWHCPLPAPWPNVTTTEPPTRAQVAELVTQARERAERRRHGDSR